MIENNQEIIDESVRCSSCEKEGHKLDSVIVKTEAGYRTLKFCICCGSPLTHQNLNCIEDQNRTLDSSSRTCLAINIL